MMLARGLPTPTSPSVPGGAQPSPPSAKVYSLGGVLPIGNVGAALAMDRSALTAEFQDKQNQPVITALAGYIRGFFNEAQSARQVVEQEMLEALMARRGEYTASKLQLIRENRQPVIYMMLAAAKMRQVEALLRDAIIGTGAEKPWTAKPTPDPELPPEAVQMVVGALQAEIEQAMMSGFPPSIEQAQARLREMRDELMPRLMEEAQKRCDRMELKMEDQLLEGGYMHALDEMITDVATFKTAFLAGPIPRKKPQLSWGQMGEMVVEDKIVLEWERVDPFDIFPAKWASDLNRDPFIRKHRLSRAGLNDLIGTEGFDETAIRKVLELYDRKGLVEWSATESQKAIAEGKQGDYDSGSGLIDALQYFGSASGRMLLEWGIEPARVADPDKEYQIEAWVVGPYVIKAMLNADPLARRPVYAWSFHKIPGSVWGNSPYDLMKDCQDMCNAAARALAANMAISSGPQVGIISNRLPPGEDVTEMFPWKIWQFESDPMGSTAKPIEFFQPSSNANELMAVFEKFSVLADEYTGIPRYMAGFNGGDGGAGRTASGISMMIGNAGKAIKQVVGGADWVIQQMLERLYYYNMRYGTDPDLKGDVKLIARGASSLITKEAARVRNNELLQVALQSPVAQRIMGIEGVAELLRSTVKTLDHNSDRVVPPLPVLRQRMAEEQQQQMMMLAMQGGAPGGSPQGSPAGPNGGRQLQDGSPAADNFSARSKQ